jgi:hypothetical protein
MERGVSDTLLVQAVNDSSYEFLKLSAHLC